MFLPKTVKSWLAVFRGDVAPLLILLSTMAGFWFGLTPGWYGIHVALLAVALVVNINFGIFILFAGMGKAVCFAAAPLLYHTGAWAQRDLGGMLTWLTALPIVGITNVSRYSVAGSLVLGPILGLVLGSLLALSVQRFRTTWLRLDEDSETFKRWMSSKWVSFLARILVGKKKTSAAEALKKRPKYVRMPGVVLAIVVCVAAAVGASLVTGDMLTGHVERSLTDANGAQVDIGQLDLGILKGRVSAQGIAATDPERPTHNRLEIAELTADVSPWELLRGRVVMEEVILSTVALDSERATAGEVVQTSEPTDAEVDEEEARLGKLGLPGSDMAMVESYFNNADQVRERLRKLQEWLPRGSSPQTEETGTVVPPESYLAYLDAVAPKSPTPRLIIKKLTIDNVTIPIDGLGDSRILCSDLSDAPSGLSDPVVIGVASSEHQSSLKLTSDYERNGGSSTIEASFADFDLAELQKNLKSDNPVVFNGGRASATVQGTMTREWMDLSLAISINELKAKATGGIGSLDPKITSEAMKVLNELEMTVRIVGPTGSPRLVIDSKALGQSLRDALTKAGKDELARRAGDLLGGALPEGVPGFGSKGATGGDALNPIKGLLGGESSKKPGEEAETQEKGEDVMDGAAKAIGGLFGKKKKDSGDK